MSAQNVEPLSDVSDETEAAIDDLAKYFGCSRQIVVTAMHGLPEPQWTTPEHQNSVKDAIAAYNLAIQHSEALAAALFKLSERDREHLLQGGCVTLQQIRHLSSELSGAANYYADYYAEYPRLGGKNHAALSVAKTVLRVFRILDKPITWGTRDGAPTTEYGRAVQYALACFGVKAGWKQAARVVQEEYDRRKFSAFAVVLERAMERSNPNS